MIHHKICPHSSHYALTLAGAALCGIIAWSAASVRRACHAPTSTELNTHFEGLTPRLNGA
jgi:hypothetical protein